MESVDEKTEGEDMEKDGDAKVTDDELWKQKQLLWIVVINK
jgi:hypothetical protein